MSRTSSAVALRKSMAALLQERVLPELLEHGAPRLLLARLPLQVPPCVVARPMSHPPLRESDAQKSYPEGWKWDAVQMHALHCPALYCVVEGEADLQMGVTTSMLRRDEPLSNRGGYVISLPAPAYLLFPPDVPQRTIPPWWRDEPHRGTTRLFIVRVLPVGALCTLATLRDAVYDVQYSLLIEDNQLAAIVGVLVDELSVPAADTRIAQAQLLTLMLRLLRALNARVPAMTDGLYSRFPESEPGDGRAHPSHHPAIERAHEYIQLHLHEPLTPAAIAGHVRLTPDHLNRVFKVQTGMSTMKYVTRRRLETARLLLTTSTLSVQEIGRLVGFRHLSHFSRAFSQHTGRSPLQFRRQGRPGV